MRAALAPASALMLASALAAAAPQGAPERMPAAPAPAGDAPAGDAPMVLGVQTHFSQNWSATYVDQVEQSHATSVRDGAPWAAGEPTPGRYYLQGAGWAPLTAVCRRGGSVLLTIVPRHPSYDAGLTVSSDAGIAAFATYVGAVADRYGACLAGIEVGNEINDPRNLPYAPGVDRARRYVALVRAVRDELARRGSHARVLGGSTNVIGTGFLDRLFAAGLLDAADAVAVHPYRSDAENVDREIAHLREVMRRRGRVLPIWATEFADNYRTPELAADELVKMVTLLSASGVERAYWYALVDQRWFRNMGLYAPGGQPRPAALAFARMAGLNAGGRAVRVPLATPGIALYRLGSSYVLWGAGGSVAFDGAATATDSRGRPVALAGGAIEAGADPVIVTGASGARLASAGPVVADSLLGYGQAPWSYLAQTRDGAVHPLALSDWDWTSAFFSRQYQPLRIADTTAAVAGTGGAPVRAVIRYTAPAAQRLSLSACFHKERKGDGVDLAIRAGGRVVWQQVLAEDAAATAVDVDLAAGETLDVSAGPNQSAGGDAFFYRVRLFERGRARALPCPQRPFPAS